MKTKIIPFDLETAKKIQAGEVKGAIKTKEGMKARILCTDVQDVYSIVAAITTNNSGEENAITYTNDGYYRDTRCADERDLILEVPDNEPQFKPFDRVLARGNDASLWKAGLYSHELEGKHCVCGEYYKQCIPYEGNEHLLGKTDKPKED